MANIKPREIKEAKGTLRKHRDEGLGFDAPPLDKSKAISILNESEQKWFDSIYNVLEPTGVIKETDLYSLELMAKARSTIEECEKHLTEEGRVIYISTKEGEIPKKNPWQMVMMDAVKVFSDLSYRFGMTPTDRGKMMRPNASEDDESDLSKLLRERNEE